MMDRLKELEEKQERGLEKHEYTMRHASLMATTSLIKMDICKENATTEL